MTKSMHEVRDPIHTFVYFSNDERRVIGSPFFQRLRHIRQLSMTSYVYPGAVHSRFEHCIGTMELAGRAFDVLFHPQNRHAASYEPFRDKFDSQEIKDSWKRHLRMAALLHDVGHPPFSHATESLFPDGEDHETMTKKLILESDLTEILRGSDITYDPSLVAKLAVGPKYFPDDPFEVWQQLLNEVIVGDAFGVDRMDYLLRDSHHSGAVAGKFDHDRLIQTLRILRTPDESHNGNAISVGIEHGGIHPTEALLVARYFMYMQVYLHRVSTAYNVHCERYVEKYLQANGNGHWKTDPVEFLKYTDNELLVAISSASCNSDIAGYVDAKRIIDRNHFKLAYEFDTDTTYLVASDAIKRDLEYALGRVCSQDDFYLSLSQQKDGQNSPVLKDDFSVWNRKSEPNKIVNGKRYSRILDKLVSPSHNYVIADPDKKDVIRACIDKFVKDIQKKP